MYFSKLIILREVAMLTAYMGVKHPDPVMAFDRLAVVKADAPLLETFWRDSCSKADQTLQEYLHHAPADRLTAPADRLNTQPDRHSAHPDRQSVQLCRSNDDGYHADLLLPDNWDDSQRQVLENALHAFFVHHIAARWLDIAMPEAENSHASQAEEQLALLAAALEKRKRAARPIPCIPPVPPINSPKP